MRIAWVGPAPAPGAGGVAGAAWLIVEGLAKLGHSVDLYLDTDPRQVPARVHDLPEGRVITDDPRWEWDRWYSRSHLGAFTSGLAARARTRRRLGTAMIEAHRRRAYDVVYQFSAIEVFGYRSALPDLAPLVTHPEVHIAGELRAWRRERALVAACEPSHRRALIPAVLALRARRQARDIKLASRVIGISEVFAELLASDYGVQRARIRVVPNPVDLHAFQPRSRARRLDGPLRLLFVGRISTRKGVEKLVRLSHDLDDLRTDVELRLAGGPTLWSDYRPLLAELNPRTALYVGELSVDQVRAEMLSADLFVQPSSYEPFGLTAAEALASGVPLVSSDQVGATELVSSTCCWRYPAADSRALESAVRSAISALRGPEAARIGMIARAEAERLFAPDVVARGVADVLAEAARDG